MKAPTTLGLYGLTIGLAIGLAAPAAGQAPAMPMPIEFHKSAEFGWLTKPVLASRVLDAMTDAQRWRLQGTGRLSFVDVPGAAVKASTAGPWPGAGARPPGPPADAGTRALRVDMDMFYDEPAPTRNRLSSVTLRRRFAGEDWSGYNRISMWIRPDLAGFPMLPLQIILRNVGRDTLPDTYAREGIHYVTLKNGEWQQVVWEIEPLARDRVTGIDIGYWVNKMLAEPGDRVAFEVARLELQRVEPDHYEGWGVAPGRISYSHTGYPLGASKTALASDLAVPEFELLRVDDNAAGVVALRKPVRTVDTRVGSFQWLDFSEVREPGSYVIRAGATRTRTFRIDGDVWRGTIWKAINFFFAERCGFAVPGHHGVDHLDWTATLGDRRLVMNGGWHDAGDLSQGMVNTGEATYAMFALAERLQARGEDPELLERLLEEAKWGLDWVLKVRFPGGYRIGFASNNLWTNGIIGDADDRSREALNNPNVNYIAAAAAAIAYRVLKDREPELAARSLRIAEDDWRHAVAGVEGPETWSTPAYLATPVELAGIGTLASMELYLATGERRYADKAIELARTIVASQQKAYVGPDFPLAGFFWTGPDRDTLFQQFHRGNDQAPIVALARLVEAFPDHADWMQWYAAVALHAEYLKAGARITAPYEVLPAYVYRDSDHLEMPDYMSRYRARPDAYLEQVRQGIPMGDGYYFRAFPVWFARRGNYGVLLSQAKALSAAAHLRGDGAAADLAQKQAQWIVGRNPFVQSTMYGEGYDWAQQYSVSTGDIVGSLPVGMQTRGNGDAPYWPPQNMYTYKEVWVHPVARWLWLMQDLAGPALVEGRTHAGAAGAVEFVEATTGRVRSLDADARGAFRGFLPEGEYTARSGGRQLRVTLLPGGTHHVDLRPGHALDFAVRAETGADGSVAIRLAARGEGAHTFVIRAENLDVDRPEQRLVLRAGTETRLEWRGRMRDAGAPWVAVVVPDGDVMRRRDLVGAAPRFFTAQQAVLGARE